MKFLKRLVLVLLVLGLLVFFGVPMLAGTSWAREKIAGAIREETGREVELGDVSFSWFSGLTASGVKVAQNRPDLQNEGDLFRLGALHIDVGLGDLLKKRLNVEKFTVTEPRIVIVRDAEGRFNFEDLLTRPREEARPKAPGSEKAGSAPEVLARLDIESGDILYIDMPLGTRVEMADIDTEATWTNGRLDLSMRFVLNGGNALVKGGLDLSKDPAPFQLEEFTIDGAAMDTNLAQLGMFLPLLGRHPQQAGGTVGFSLKDLAGEGFTLEQLSKSLTAKGEVKLTGGVVASGAVSQIVGLLSGGAPGDSGLSFKVLGSTFSIENGRISTKDMTLAAKDFDLRLSGWTDLAGNIDYRVSASRLDELIAKNGKLREWMGKDGVVPLRLTGTISDPRVELDLEGAVQGAIDTGIEKGLNRLFGGQKDGEKKKKRKKKR